MNAFDSRFKLTRQPLLIALLLAGAVGAWFVVRSVSGAQKEAVVPAANAASAAAPQAAASASPDLRAALTVATVNAQPQNWPNQLAAVGNIAAWQEAVIGAEAAGLRIEKVKVAVGDSVKRGQLLATLDRASVEADLAATRAALAEAKAAAAEARANGARARELAGSGAISAQQILQYETAENTALARVEAQRARLRADKVRLSQTRIEAPDDGIISARNATVGSVAQPGQELFRLIRGGRLEWRAELPASDLGRVQPGMPVSLSTPDGQSVPGQVRAVAPTVDAATRNGLVYVDLSPGSAARAGMFARGTLQAGDSQALSLPQSAVVLRDGYSYAFAIDAESRVRQIKLQTGRRQGERVEIVDGLDAQTPVVASGVGFLNDGDRVRVLGAAPASQQASAQ